MLRNFRSVLRGIRINGTQYEIPYAGAKILAVFEANSLAIKFDCRKGQCKSCAVRVRLEGEAAETLACMEEACEGMEVETAGLQPDVVVPAVPPMETKRVTTRKVAKKPPSEVQRANSKVLRILTQAQEAGMEGEWEGCADYAAELLGISENFSQPEDLQSVFLKGPCRDLIREFIVLLQTSGQQRCMELATALKTVLKL